MTKKINIAVDGWSACGKGTMAKSLAERLNYIYIDTGAMYRAFTLAALSENVDSADENELKKLISKTTIIFKKNEKTGEQEIFLNGNNVEDKIRTQKINNNVSNYSAVSLVRKFLVNQQQEMAKNKGVVMDGRDIATVVIPDAELKIFMTASPEIRARRRFLELGPKNPEITLKEVAESLEKRDLIDSTREDSPLKQADDARVLDNSFLSREEQLEIALKWAEELIN